MRNNWSKINKGDSTRIHSQENSLLRYDNTSSILQEEGEYNLTDRSNTNIPELPIPSNIQQNTSPRGVKQLSSEQLASLKECFEKFSSTKTLKKPARSRLNASGIREIMTSQPEIDITLSEKQLNQLFIDASVPLHKATLTQIYANLSRSKPGKGISFNDLLELMQQPNGSQQTQTDYEQIFKLYDRKNRGYFDYQDYKYLCQGIAKGLTEGQIREAFDMMDKQRQGRISLSKFIAVMQGIH